MSKKILLTGVTGFLGSRLAKNLLSNGYDVIALKRKTSSLSRIESALPQIHLYDAEELDFAKLFRSHPEISTIIHAATCYGRNNETVSQITGANTLFPLRLLEAAISAGVGTLINADTPLDKFLNLYALSKSQFVEWGKYFSSKNKIRFVNLRLEHFFGPGDDDSKFTAHVIKSCVKNIPELQLTPGEQKRDFIYIDDVVSAYLILLEKMDAFAERFVEFDVGSGKPIAIKEFVQTVHRLAASHCRLDFGALPYRNGEVMLSQADIKPLTRLGWVCKTSLEQGLKMTMEGLRQ